VLLCTSLGGLASACAGSDGDRTLTVLAAASLTGSFSELAAEFVAGHDDVDVRLSFDSSAALAEQVNQGAPADVLATADARTMRLVVEEGHAADPRTFATNRLVLVVPRGNPAGIETFGDLDDPEVDYLVCVRSAPCGALAAEVLADNRIDARPASEEVDVKAVLSKVVLDEADAGLVYATDAVAAGDDVERVPVPASEEATNTYAIVSLDSATEPQLARAWIDLVLSDRGRRMLHDAGFGQP
jgi:molybdate transport system substrate-binding protein